MRINDVSNTVISKFSKQFVGVHSTANTLWRFLSTKDTHYSRNPCYTKHSTKSGSIFQTEYKYFPSEFFTVLYTSLDLLISDSNFVTGQLKYNSSYHYRCILVSFKSRILQK